MEVKGITNHAIERFKERVARPLGIERSEKEIKKMFKEAISNYPTQLIWYNPLRNLSETLKLDLPIIDSLGIDFGLHQLVLKKDQKKGKKKKYSVVTVY
jgi:hypothetical protein